MLLIQIFISNHKGIDQQHTIKEFSLLESHGDWSTIYI